MGTNGTLYDDPGTDFYTRLTPDKAKHRAIEQLRRMGHTVTLEPTGNEEPLPR
jgi:transposase